MLKICIKNLYILFTLILLSACSMLAVADNGVNYVSNYSSRNYIQHSEACEKENLDSLTELKKQLKKEPEFQLLLQQHLAGLRNTLYYKERVFKESKEDVAKTISYYVLAPYGVLKKEIDLNQNNWPYTPGEVMLKTTQKISTSKLRHTYRQKKIDIIMPCLLRKYSISEIERYKENVVPSFHDKG